MSAHNLGLALRKLLGAGTPREWKNRAGRLILRLPLWVAYQLSPENAVGLGSAVAGAGSSVHRSIKRRARP